MNRLQDTTCTATGCGPSSLVGKACYMWGTTTLGTLTNKCGWPGYSSTCGYLYCIKN